VYLLISQLIFHGGAQYPQLAKYASEQI